jgi:hypothetical protein
MLKTFLLTVAAALAAVALNPSPAAALAPRAFVSGKGTDAAACGAPTNACRPLQYVHDNIIAAGGEIDVLDPAGYGAIVIGKALSIVNDGAGTAGVQAASGNAITINAPSDAAVHLRGLNIDGLGTGANGVVFNSGGSLAIVNCVIRHFAGYGATGNGVLIQPTTGSMSFVISNTIASDNAFGGIIYFPPSGTANANGVIDHVVTANNAWGVDILASSQTGGRIAVAISNTVASNNSFAGVNFGTGAATLNSTVDSLTASNNQFGLSLGSTGNVVLSRSVITLNTAYGVDNDSSWFYTLGDNNISLNSTDVHGTAMNNVLYKPQ